MRFNLTFNRGVDEPSIDQLLPIVDDRNPLYISEGNPNLLPRVENSVRLNAHYSIPVSGFRIYLWSSYSDVETEIINDEKVDDNLITQVQPINYKGGIRGNANMGIGIPILGDKLRADINFSSNYGESYALVNSIENETTQFTWNPSMNLDISPVEWISLYLSASTRRTSTQYDINTSQDQQTVQNTLGGELNLKFGKSLGWESSYDHSFYTNDRFNVDTSVPLINSSIYWRFLKGNKGTLRLSAYDLLDRNIGFSQYAGANFVSSSQTQSLARYFMLSFTYDLRGGAGGGLNTGQRINIRM
jgi:hypothetical protein